MAGDQDGREDALPRSAAVSPESSAASVTPRRRDITPSSVIALGIAMVCAAAISVWVGNDLSVARESVGWPTVEGIIAEYEVSEGSPDRRPWRTIRLRYTYEVGATSYTGRRYGVARPPSDDSGLIAGASVTVHYDPTDPARSVLSPGPSWGVWIRIVIAGLLVLAVGYSGVYALLAWLRKR